MGYFENWVCKIEKVDYYSKVDIIFWVGLCEYSKVRLKVKIHF